MERLEDALNPVGVPAHIGYKKTDPLRYGWYGSIKFILSYLIIVFHFIILPILSILSVGTVVGVIGAISGLSLMGVPGLLIALLLVMFVIILIGVLIAGFNSIIFVYTSGGLIGIIKNLYYNFSKDDGVENFLFRIIQSFLLSWRYVVAF